MMRSNYSASYIALVVLTTTALASCALIDPSPEATIEKDVAGQLYLTNCAGCHGLNGEPGDSVVRNLRTWQGSFERFDTALTNGPGVMPEYPAITPDERHKLYEYILRFRR